MFILFWNLCRLFILIKILLWLLVLKCQLYKTFIETQNSEGYSRIPLANYYLLIYMYGIVVIYIVLLMNSSN
jgi:uncharacterized membrane protein